MYSTVEERTRMRRRVGPKAGPQVQHLQVAGKLEVQRTQAGHVPDLPQLVDRHQRRRNSQEDCFLVALVPIRLVCSNFVVGAQAFRARRYRQRDYY